MSTELEKWGLPTLRPDMLATTIPTRTYGGGRVSDPSQQMVLWRTVRTEMARGSVLSFYVDDWRIEALWTQKTRYASMFQEHQVGALIEADFSLWSDAPLIEQLHNTYRTRALSRYWQECGLKVIPSLNWGDARTFGFCFHGIPVGAPVVACEARTASKPQDREAFLRGLQEGVRQVKPGSVLVYGGTRHQSWLQGALLKGPTYYLLENWRDARNRFLHRDKYTRAALRLARKKEREAKSQALTERPSRSAYQETRERVHTD